MRVHCIQSVRGRRSRRARPRPAAPCRASAPWPWPARSSGWRRRCQALCRRAQRPPARLAQHARGRCMPLHRAPSCASSFTAADGAPGARSTCRLAPGGALASIRRTEQRRTTRGTCGQTLGLGARRAPRAWLTHRYTAGSRSSGVVARTARKALMSIRVIAWRLLSAEMLSNVAARKANGTRAPGAQVASAARSKSACSAAAATAPVPTPSTCMGRRARQPASAYGGAAFPPPVCLPAEQPLLAGRKSPGWAQPLARAGPTSRMQRDSRPPHTSWVSVLAHRLPNRHPPSALGLCAGAAPCHGVHTRRAAAEHQAPLRAKAQRAAARAWQRGRSRALRARRALGAALAALG